MKFEDVVAVVTALLSADEFRLLVEIVYATSIPETAKSARLLELLEEITDVMLIISVEIE